MPTHHSLALPLSADYDHDVRDGFSFFTTTATTSDLHPTVVRYLDDLCSFLRAARVIQAHPENYFQFMRGETLASSAVHFDGTAVEAEELQLTTRLLKGFVPLLRGENAMARLCQLVRDGPPELPTQASSSSDDSGTSLPALHAFYQQTRRLMLGRARRPENDAATATLLPPTASTGDEEEAAAARAHQAQILDLVVSHGMNPKKQHEVRIMRDTVHDLVECCNSNVAAHDASQLTSAFDDAGQPLPLSPTSAAAVRVETAINIGEGKGYVSRAVALCDNLQVIGLDCNPGHKERAVERVELLLETSLSSRSGIRRVNLLYEPRGHVASIACRVGERVDWKALLQGHVLTREETCSCTGRRHGEESPIPPGQSSAHQEADKDALVGAVDDVTPAAVLSGTRGEESVKLACRLCGKVVRLENTAVVMKHIYTHLHEAASHGNTGTTAAASLLPTSAQLREWNLTLSQHAYVAKLTETFYTVADVDARHRDNRKDAALLKRTRDSRECTEDGEEKTGKAPAVAPAAAAAAAAEAAAGYLTLSHAPCEGTSSSTASITLQPTHTARGYRALLLLAKPVPSTSGAVGTQAALPPPSPSPPLAEEEEEEEAHANTGSNVVTWVYHEQLVTIVGYDGGIDAHQVCYDGENKKRVLRLYRVPVTSEAPAPQSLTLTLPPPAAVAVAETAYALLGDWQLPDPAVWGRAGVAVVRNVLPPALPSTPVVDVPSVRNTVLLGLHPCGDLGSNVCRIFRNSGARGLLLVSCCWHSLTPHGFPLSRALRQRGMTTSSVSLLLATQPLDAWSTASPEGHRSSAKLLFFRSLFKLLWARLAQEWAAEAHPCPTRRGGSGQDKAGEAASCECDFPTPPPHLEPVFLRRISRYKDTITFREFVDAIAVEYLYRETAKDTPYTPWNIGARCTACRDAQEAFVRAALTVRGVPQKMAEMYGQEHFAQFLGLTVLRMWMCHLVESLFLLDRTLYLHEELCAGGAEDSAVSLVPLFDGALSPRMYGILARRGGSA